LGRENEGKSAHILFIDAIGAIEGEYTKESKKELGLSIGSVVLRDTLIYT